MMRDVDTAALRCFVTAVRAGSMGRAAEVLGRTQPAISQQVRRLEDIPRLLAPAPQRERRGDDGGRRGLSAPR
jgi:DNA-binding transcriptional LysR family regulator